MSSEYDIDQKPRVVARVFDEVEADFRCFLLQDFNRFGEEVLELEDENTIMSTGRSGAIFGSGGNDHYPSVEIELWNGEPPQQTTQWEATAEGRVFLDDPGSQLRLMSTMGATTPTIIEPGAEGEYGIRAFVNGREAAAARGEGEFYAGVERWLLQIWRLSDETD